MSLFINKSKKELISWCKSHPDSISKYKRRRDILYTYWNLCRIYSHENLKNCNLGYIMNFKKSTLDGFIELNQWWSKSDYNDVKKSIETIASFAHIPEYDEKKYTSDYRIHISIDLENDPNFTLDNYKNGITKFENVLRILAKE